MHQIRVLILCGVNSVLYPRFCDMYKTRWLICTGCSQTEAFRFGGRARFIYTYMYKLAVHDHESKP